MRALTSAICAAFVLLGCASKPAMRFHASVELAGSTYRTYKFVEPVGTDTAGYSTFITTCFKDAIRREIV